MTPAQVGHYLLVVSADWPLSCQRRPYFVIPAESLLCHASGGWHPEFYKALLRMGASEGLTIVKPLQSEVV